MNASTLPTQPLYRDDARLRECEATVIAVDARGVQLDRTVFYPTGGGQAGDAGELLWGDGGRLAITDTRKGGAEDPAGTIVHVPAAETSALPAVGERVIVRLDWSRRWAHMRFHTATHLLCALVPHPVDGCSITAGYARLDFHMTEPLDKDALTEGLARLIAGGAAVRERWIRDDELDANPQLVRSMSVQPPRGSGRVRLLEIEGIDLQPCGGTHVSSLAEIGEVVVTKVEKKSARTRRVVLGWRG